MRFGLLLLLLFYFHLVGQSDDDVRILGIRVEFVEDNSGLTTGNGKFDLSSSSALYQIDPPPHNKTYFNSHIKAVSDYYRSVSNDRQNIDGTVFPEAELEAYQLPLEMFHYSPNLGEEEANKGLARLFQDALHASESDTAIDYSEYNCVVIFHAGVGKDIFFDFDDTPEDIASIFITPEFLQKYLGQSEILLRNGTVAIDRGLILPETESQAGIQLGMNGIFAANMGSYFGLPDLFDTNEKTSVVGSFGLMDAGLFNMFGVMPSRPMAWSRQFKGWDDPTTLVPGNNEKFTISSVSGTDNSTYKISFSSTESFWLEHRWNGNVDHDSLRVAQSSDRDTLMTIREYLETNYSNSVTFDSVTGVMIHAENYDLGLPGSGILIWRVDQKIIDEKLTENRVNDNPEMRGISLIEADGAQDIGQQYSFLDPAFGSSLGYIFDLWFNGNPMPFYTNEFNSTTFPPAESHHNHAASGVSIDNFSGRGEVMSFKMSDEFSISGFPKYFSTTVVPYWAPSQDDDNIFFFTEDSLKVFNEGLFVTGLEHSIVDISSLIFDRYTTQNKTILATSNNDFLWLWSYNAGVVVFIDSLNTSNMERVALGNMRLALLSSDSVLEYSIHENNLTLLKNEDLALPSYPVYLDSTLFLLDNSIDAIFSSPDSIYKPLYEESAGSWWILSRSGQFSLFNADFSIKKENNDLDLRIDNQPVLAYNRSPGQEIPTILFISGNKLFGFDKNGYSGENFPMDLEDFGRSDGSEVLVAEFDMGQTFLLRNRYGILFALDASGKIRFDVRHKVEAPSIYWVDSNGINGVMDDSVWIAIGSGLQSGSWNGPGGGEIPYRVSLPVNSSGNNQGIFAENSVYNWPNPNIENFTNIRCRLNIPGTINIKIVDLTGDLVLNKSFAGQTGINEYRWDLSNVSSGIYFANVSVSTTGNSATRIIKIMVIK